MCLSYLYVHTVWGLRPLILTNRDGGYRTRFGGADWNRGGHKRPQMRGAGELPSRFLSTCRGGRKPETKVFGLEGCPLQVAMSSSLARVFQLGWSDLTDEGEFALQVQFGLGENGSRTIITNIIIITTTTIIMSSAGWVGNHHQNHHHQNHHHSLADIVLPLIVIFCFYCSYSYDSSSSS